MQDLSVVKDSRPSVPEDRAAREVRRLSVAQKKKEKDAAKKRQIRKVLEREALNRHHASKGSRVSPSRSPPLR
jgi:hypothetical protein